MKKSNLNGIVQVKSHTRNGVTVKSYSRGGKVTTKPELSSRAHKGIEARQKYREINSKFKSLIDKANKVYKQDPLKVKIDGERPIFRPTKSYYKATPILAKKVYKPKGL